MMNLQNWFEKQAPGISLKSAESVLQMVSDGATVPFMARYRKEATGGLDEVQIQAVIDAKEEWDTITERQKFILGEIEKQGKLTDELKTAISNAFDSNKLEDLYLPYKIKKKSKATLAKEAGLQDLADWIWDCGHALKKPEPGQTLELWALTFKNEEKGFADAEKCIQGAQDILIERLSERADLRQKVRDALFAKGQLHVSKASKAKPNSKYETYFAYHEPIQNLLKPENSHRFLAIRRGWMEEELTLSIGGPLEDTEFEAGLLRTFETEACTDLDSVGAALLLQAAKTAFKVHVLHSIENEVNKSLKTIADTTAIQVFAENVKKLLLAAPFGPKAVLGVDPGIRTGCKLAVINDSGKFIADTVIHLQTEDQKQKAKELLKNVLTVGEIQAIAVGNGTAGRETEVFVRQSLKEAGLSIPVVMVSEAGASVYSASEAAREEFPELDVTVRGAISIARRLQDPLAELVKIEPKSIGVGQYQHDVAPHSLKKSLELVVDNCVNSVGVNLNTASHYLLSRVAGIGPALAKSIVEVRTVKGLFKSRQSLLDIPRFSQKTFEQAAGFLKIPESENPLDNTGVHPERYETLEKVAKDMGKSIKDLIGSDGVKLLRSQKELKNELGEFTFEDVLKELEKPGRDPREAFTPFSYRDDIFEMKDLQPGMICPGIVSNVTNFGAFVDIGVHQDGLVHLSQLANRFIKDPRDIVSPGDRVTVKVIEVNLDKKQIALSMKLGEPEARAPKPQRAKPQREPRPEQPKKEVPPPRAGIIKPPSEMRKSPIKPGGGKPRREERQTEKNTQLTHNPFAALAGLKKDLK